jgi:glycosyltransferase involved in cell wall biosynthesis
MTSITFAMWGLGGSGGERLIYRLSNKLLEDGYKVNLVSIVGYGFNEKMIKNYNENIFIQNKLSRILFSLQYLFEYNKKYKAFSSLVYPLYKINSLTLYNLLRKVKGDIIIATSFYTAEAVAKAGGTFHLVQDTFEMFSFGHYASRRVRLMEKAFSLPLIKLSISNVITTQLKKYSNEIRYIGNFIDDIFFKCETKPPSLRKRIITTIARSSYHKGFDIFIESIMELLKIRRDFEIVIINPQDSNIPIPFNFKPVRNPSDKELCEIYASSYIFVFPSRAEGFGLPPLEAMACGTPVIVTDNGGSRDYAINRINSIVVPVNDPISITRAIIELLDNPELADKLSHNAIITSKKFTFEKFYNRFLNAIKI